MSLHGKAATARAVAGVAFVGVFLSGCASYGLKAKFENGNDAPPFVTAEQVESGRFSLNPGDTIAWYGPGKLLKSTRARVDLVSRNLSTSQEKKPSKSEAKADQPSKLQVKTGGLLKRAGDAEEKGKSARKDEGESKSKAKADEKSKGQRKSENRAQKNESKENRPGKMAAKAAALGKTSNDADDKTKSERKADKPSKDERKGGGMSKAQRKAGTVQMFLAKTVAKSDDEKPEFAPHVEIREDKDAKRVVYEITVTNSGDADFSGDVLIFDQLPEGMRMAGVRGAFIKKPNSLKTTMLIVPLIGPFISMMMPDEHVDPVPSRIFSHSESDQRVKFDLQNVRIEEGSRLAVVFDVSF